MNVWNTNPGTWGGYPPQQPFQNAPAQPGAGMGPFFQPFQQQNFVQQQQPAGFVPQQPRMLQQQIQQPQMQQQRMLQPQMQQQPPMQQQMGFIRPGLLRAPVPSPVPTPTPPPHQIRGGLLGNRPTLIQNPTFTRAPNSGATTRALYSAAAAPPPPPPPGPPPKSPSRPPPPPSPEVNMDLDDENRPGTPEEELDEDEKAFKREFSEWEKKYEAWKEQNKNHPDKAAYQRYEAEWNTWRTKLLEKKESMRKERVKKRAAANESSNPVPRDRFQPNVASGQHGGPLSSVPKDRPVPVREIVEVASLIDPDDDGGNETGAFWSRQRKRTDNRSWLSGERDNEKETSEGDAFPLLIGRKSISEEDKPPEKNPELREEDLREPLPTPSPEPPVTEAVAKIVGRVSSDSEDESSRSVSQRESTNSTPNRRPLLPTPPPPTVDNSDLKAILASVQGNSAAAGQKPPQERQEEPEPVDQQAAARKSLLPTPPEVVDLVEEPAKEQAMELVDLEEEEEEEKQLFERRGPSVDQEAGGFQFGRQDFDARVGVQQQQQQQKQIFTGQDVDHRDRDDRFQPFAPRAQAQFGPRLNSPALATAPNFSPVRPGGPVFQQQQPPQPRPLLAIPQPNQPALFPQQQQQRPAFPQQQQPGPLMSIPQQNVQPGVFPPQQQGPLFPQQQQQQQGPVFPQQQGPIIPQQQPRPLMAIPQQNIRPLLGIPQQNIKPALLTTPPVEEIPQQRQMLNIQQPQVSQMGFNNPNIRPQQPWAGPQQQQQQQQPWANQQQQGWNNQQQGQGWDDDERDDWPSIEKMKRMSELMKRRVEAEKKKQLDSCGNTPDYEEEEDEREEDRGGKRGYLEEYEERVLPAFKNSPWWLSHHRDNLPHKSILQPEPDLDSDPNVHVFDEEDMELLVAKAKVKNPVAVKKETFAEEDDEDYNNDQAKQQHQNQEEDDASSTGVDEDFDMRWRDSPWLPYHLDDMCHPSYTAKETRRELGAKAPEWTDSPWREMHEDDLNYPYETELQRLKRMAAEPLPYKPLNFEQYDIDALLADKRLPSVASSRAVEVKGQVARPPGPALRAEATKVWVEEYGEFVEFRNYTDRGLEQQQQQQQAPGRWSPKRGRNRIALSPEPLSPPEHHSTRPPPAPEHWPSSRGRARLSLSPGDLSPISDDEGTKKKEVRHYPEQRSYPQMVQVERRPPSRERDRDREDRERESYRERDKERENRDYRRRTPERPKPLNQEALKDAPAWTYRSRDQSKDQSKDRARETDREHDRDWQQKELSRQEERDRIFGNHWASRKVSRSPSIEEVPSSSRTKEMPRSYRRPRSRTRSRTRSRSGSRRRDYSPRRSPGKNQYKKDRRRSRSSSSSSSSSSSWQSRKDIYKQKEQGPAQVGRKEEKEKETPVKKELGANWFDNALHELENDVLGPLAGLVVPPPPSLKAIKDPVPVVAPPPPEEEEDDDDDIVPPPPPSLRAMMMAAQAAPPKSSVVDVEELIFPPGRSTRPERLVVILRGPPGAGKSHVAKLMKDKEVEFGANAPRICGLDDYFMTEVDQFVTDENGRRTKTKVMKYEYEPELEDSYRQSLVKAVKKTVDDGYFPFIIVDCIHDKVAHFQEMAAYARSRGFRVYVVEMNAEPALCHRRNLHDRTLKEVEDIVAGWEATPTSFTLLKVDRLFEDPIEEVEMELEDDGANPDMEMDTKEEFEDDEMAGSDHVPSKWDRMEHTGEKLDKLDCMRMRKKSAEPETLEDWLQNDDYYGRNPEPGKKRVRWADIEAKKEQMRRRELGFVVGHTNWNIMNDPDFGAAALTQTKYFSKD